MARGFNGSSDRITASGVASTGSPVTIACWVNPANISSTQCLVSLGNNTSNQYALRLLSAQVQADCRSNGATDTVVTSSTGIAAANVWHHATSVFLGAGGVIAYLDGAGKSANASANSGDASARTGGASIGVENLAGSGNFFFTTGNIAEAGIWSVQLSDAEILALANGVRCYTIRPASLIAYWPLDGLQSPEPDFSGTASNGTLTGTSSIITGPPLMQFTPRWPQTTPSHVVSTAVFRRTLSPVGTRVGSRQIQGWA